MILQEYILFSGEIVSRSGLRIGGSGGQLEIGAVDNTILRHPLSDEPYIPGSSLKGKLRSGLEALQQNHDSRGQPQDVAPCGCGRCLVCRLFGPYQNTRSEAGPTRLLVRDLPLTEATRQAIREYTQQGLSYIEEKTENLINRKTRAATNPRTSERVPSGLAFDLQLVLRVFEGDKRDELIDAVERALGLATIEGLGGSVSRGYGQIQVRDLRWTARRAADERVSSTS